MAAVVRPHPPVLSAAGGPRLSPLPGHTSSAQDMEELSTDRAMAPLFAVEAEARAEEDTCGPQPMLASIVYIEAIASMYHSGGLVGISHAGVPAC
jgi:hypothetical protein